MADDLGHDRPDDGHHDGHWTTPPHIGRDASPGAGHANANPIGCRTEAANDVACHTPRQNSAAPERRADLDAHHDRLCSQDASQTTDDDVLLSLLPSTLSRRAPRRTRLRKVSSPIGVDVVAASASSHSTLSSRGGDRTPTSRARSPHPRRAQPDARANAAMTTRLTPDDAPRKSSDDGAPPTPVDTRGHRQSPPDAPNTPRTTDDPNRIRRALRGYWSNVFRRQPTDQRL